MYIKPRIDISIDCSTYEHIINSVRLKAPLEIGVETAVYMLMFGLLAESEFDVVDVNTMWRRYAKVYSNAKDKDSFFGAVPDLVIVGKEFNFNNKMDENHAFGFVEIKSIATKDIEDTDEIKSHKSNTNHLIWTNGAKWYYFNMNSQELNWSIDLTTDNKDDSDWIRIDECKFGELLYCLNQIDWRH